MRLLRVIRGTDPESGGPIEALRSTSEVMVRAGHQVEVVSLETPAAARQHALPFAVHALGPGSARYGYNPRLTSWIRDNASRFDAVLLHGLWNYTSVGAWRALRKLGVPYFVHVHGMMDPWFRQQYPLKHIQKQVYWWLAEGRVLHDAQAVLFTSEDEMLRARHCFLGYTYRERVVSYGTADPGGDPVAQQHAFFRAFPQMRGQRLLLFLGRIHPKKGCDLLLQAFANQARYLPETLDLVIAGPDQTGMRSQLQSLALRLGIASRVHWPAMLSGDLKWGAFHVAEAFILPSHQENFGVAVAEAMACSKPVLISDKVNIWREVLAAGAGFVAPDTADGTALLIRQFLSLSVEERLRMGAQARSAFLQNFHSEAAGHDLLRVLEPPSLL